MNKVFGSHSEPFYQKSVPRCDRRNQIRGSEQNAPTPPQSRAPRLTLHLVGAQGQPVDPCYLCPCVDLPCRLGGEGVWGDAVRACCAEGGSLSAFASSRL